MGRGRGEGGSERRCWPGRPPGPGEGAEGETGARPATGGRQKREGPGPPGVPLGHPAAAAELAGRRGVSVKYEYFI